MHRCMCGQTLSKDISLHTKLKYTGDICEFTFYFCHACTHREWTEESVLGIFRHTVPESLWRKGVSMARSCEKRNDPECNCAVHKYFGKAWLLESN